MSIDVFMDIDTSKFLSRGTANETNSSSNSQDTAEEFVFKKFVHSTCRKFTPSGRVTFRRNALNLRDKRLLKALAESANSFAINPILEHQICANCGVFQSLHITKDDSKGKLEPCKDFGTVTFEENGRTADFVRLAAQQTKGADLAEYIKKFASTDVAEDPDMLISTHGSFDCGRKDEVVVKEFEKLVYAMSTIALVSRGWVTGLGHKSQQLFSFSQLDSMIIEIDPYHRKTVTSVGFVTWDNLDHKWVFADKDTCDLRKYPPEANLTKNTRKDDLSVNYTLYVLVDCGSSNSNRQADSVQKLRLNFEDELVNMKSQRIPVLNIFACGTVVDGLQLVQKTRKGEQVILVFGLGGFCDKMVEFLRNPKLEKFSSDSEHAAVLSQLAAIQNNENLHIIDLQTEDDCQNVFNVASELLPPVKKLKLAIYDSLEGNFPSVIGELTGNSKLIGDCVEAFKCGLLEQQFDLIEGLLSCNFEMDKHFNEDFLVGLYIEAITYNPPLLTFMNRYSQLDLRNSETNFKIDSLDGLLRGVLKVPKGYPIDLEMNRQLFVFSILRLDKKLSNFFWKRCDEPMAAAIYAKVLLEEMKSAGVFKQDAELLQEMIVEFEGHASEFLETFYREDPTLALKSLTSKEECWFNFTPLDLAERGVCNTYFSEWAVTKLQFGLFYGCIHASASLLRVALSILLVFPAFISLPWTATYKNHTYFMRGTFVQHCPTSGSQMKKNDGFLSDIVPTGFNIGTKLLVKSLYTTPVAKYLLDSVYMFIFVVCQSYMLLFNYRLHTPISTVEGFLFWLSCCNLLKDLIGCLWYEQTRWSNKFNSYYLANKWNLVSTINSIIYIIGASIHANSSSNSMSQRTHIAHVFSILFSYAILLRSCLVLQFIGPYIVMMEKMTKDLFYFLFVVLIFVVCYGICLQSLLFVNQPQSGWSVVYGIFFKPFLHIFGENFLDSLAVSGNCDQEGYLFDNCDLSYSRPIIALLLFIGYSIVVNIMLVNLLIAIFSSTYEQINENSNLYWNLVFYRIAVKYYSREHNFPGPVFMAIFLFDIGKILARQFLILIGRELQESTEEVGDQFRILGEKQILFRAKKMEKIIFKKYFMDNQPKRAY